MATDMKLGALNEEVRVGVPVPVWAPQLATLHIRVQAYCIL